jgi:hypothetical protein
MENDLLQVEHGTLDSIFLCSSSAQEDTYRQLEGKKAHAQMTQVGSCHECPRVCTWTLWWGPKQSSPKTSLSKQMTWVPGVYAYGLFQHVFLSHP